MPPIRHQQPVDVTNRLPAGARAPYPGSAMHDDRADLLEEDNPHPPDLPLSRRELVLVAGFWLVYGTLTVANRIFDRGPGPGFGPTSGVVLAAVVEAAGWALLTPWIFKLAARHGAGRRRPADLAILAGVGILIAVAIPLTTGALRHPGPPPGAPGRHGGGPGGPPFWFGFLNALVIYLGVLAAGLARTYSLRYQARRQQTVALQARLAEARLDALRRQLDPHFLFNTLNAISSLVERDPRGVRRMVARLAELLRASLDRADRPEIALRDELALLERYLDIMRVRLQDRLEVSVQVDDRVLDTLVPTLLLQPLVENAIRHGIEKRTDGGRIWIEGAETGGTLTLRVRDNGPSGAADTAETGVGLGNTRARLQQLYGSAHRFALEPAEGGGMVAEVQLPIRWQPADVR
jgi:two-component system, LytTR family, sensor kinase